MGMMLDARGMMKSFGGLRAVDKVSFTVAHGETVGIVGPNGAGKTTLFNLLTNEIKPDQGNVFLSGQDLGPLETHQRVKAGLVRTFQVPRSFSGLTIRDNIRLSMMKDDIVSMLIGEVDENRESELAISVGLNPEQLDAYPTELAMGDLRKLELARTLASNPKLLLLDEVFAGLTFGEIEQISQLLVERKRDHGLTTMIVSHDLKSLAPLVDRVIVINFGRVLDMGRFDEVMGNPEVQSAYLGTGGLVHCPG